MDEELRQLLLFFGLFGGGTAVGVTALAIMERLKEDHAKYLAPKLDADYGKRIRDNLSLLEEAARSNDNPRAKDLLKERAELIETLGQINSLYLDNYVSDEVRQDIRKGKALEEYLR